MSGNQVNVDHEQLAAEAERVELPPESAGNNIPGAVPGAVDQAPPVESPPAPWSEITPGLIEALDIAVCPNWELTDGEKHALDAALAPALDQLFPGGIGDPRWAPYFRLLSVTVAIVAVRFDKKTFKLRALRASKSGDAGVIAHQTSSFVPAAGDDRH